MLLYTCIILICMLLGSFSSSFARAAFNLSLPHQHPYPESVVHDIQRRLNVSVSRRQALSVKDQCLTGNPIDDCWRCDPEWYNNRQRLADCSIGFGQGTLGGKGGRIYTVVDSSDNDVANPKPGTLRHAVIQDEPLWIIFSTNMVIKLKHELIFNSYKTVDGRGTTVHITGNGCITLQYVQHIIIHNIHVRHCKPSGNADIASTPTHVGWRGRSDGDGISIFGSQKIWIDHCALSYCTDGLIDAIMGSTGITVSNSYFSHHNEVMLLGHDDRYLADSGMQVTIAFNHFGEALVTKRVDTDEREWAGWNWRTDGDLMVNGAYFVPSGAGVSAQYAKASSVEPRSAAYIEQLTFNAGVFGEARYVILNTQYYPLFLFFDQ
ncbi:putative pectate lyase 13 [Hibiscus syriacus]|uniref:Pectate lyase n=1 Tax=Hibiscus syriacus TaxID=106335 RepID=A0A6A3BEC2_HIBSY|nr:putative pectate lyase 13 [Hibiscus syriacus]